MIYRYDNPGMQEDREIIDPPMEGLQSKGLKKGSVSLVGAVAIGFAATAPAYSLTGALTPWWPCHRCSTSGTPHSATGAPHWSR